MKTTMKTSFCKLAIIVLCSLCGINAQADEIKTGKCGDNIDFYYNLTTGEFRMTGTGKPWDVGYGAVDATYLPVENMKYVEVGEGITELVEYQFCHSGMLSVVLPKTLTSLKWNAFFNCSKLKEITFPENLSYISDWTFRYNASLEKIRSLIKEPNVEGIRDGSFNGLEKDKITLYVPDALIEKYWSSALWSGFKAIKTFTQEEEEKKAKEEAEKLKVTGVEIISEHGNCFIGESAWIIQQVLPSTAENKNVSFSSNNPTVASIDAKTGLVQFSSEGEATITVTTEEGGFKASIKIKVEKRKSTNANLESLELNFEIKPAFNKNTTDYYATVGSDIDRAAIIARTEDEYATATCNFQTLKSGDNKIIIHVTAEDTTVVKEYYLHIYRKSKEARLKSLTVNQGSLEPGFKPDTKEYIWRITKKDPYMKISTVPMHDKAIAEEIKSSFKGDTTFLILTTAEDNRYGEKYTVKVEAYNDNAYLKDLKVEEFELKPEFQPHVSRYDVTVPNETREVKVVAVPDDSNATISGETGWIQITGAEMLFTINVLAEDRISHHAYQIRIQKEALVTDIEKVEDFYDERVYIYTVDGRYLGVTERENKKIVIPDWLGHGVFIAKGCIYIEKFTN